MLRKGLAIGTTYKIDGWMDGWMDGWDTYLFPTPVSPMMMYLNRYA